VCGKVRYGGEYVKKTEAEYAEQVRSKLEKGLHRRAKELGFTVTKVEPPAEVAVEPARRDRGWRRGQSMTNPLPVRVGGVR